MCLCDAEETGKRTKRSSLSRLPSDYLAAVGIMIVAGCSFRSLLAGQTGLGTVAITYLLAFVPGRARRKKVGI